MKILVRLPNWLGDMVMSVYFTRAVAELFPQAEISVIAKKGLEGLLDYFPPLQHRFIFSKNEYSGITGLFRFGREIRAKEQFDLFFCLPDSFSSAFMAWASGAKHRVGYRKEGRNFLLTHSYRRDGSEHRVVQYLRLLEQFSGKKTDHRPTLQIAIPKGRAGIIINIHSEAQSRRLPLAKAVSLINEIARRTQEPITLIGGPKDVEYTRKVTDLLDNSTQVKSMAGKTSLPELVNLFTSSKAMLSSDSGPAHLAGASGLPLVVIFGAGDELETGPYYRSASSVVRLGKLSCEPCRKNECKFGIDPPCLTDLDEHHVVTELLKLAAG